MVATVVRATVFGASVSIRQRNPNANAPLSLIRSDHTTRATLTQQLAVRPGGGMFRNDATKLGAESIFDEKER